MVLQLALLFGVILAVQAHNFPGFTRMPHPCCGKDISARGTEVMLTGSDNGIYRWNGKNFVYNNGCAFAISASPDGWHWAIGCDKKAYRWNPTANRWEQIPSGELLHISAAGKDRAVAAGLDGKGWFWDGKWSLLFDCCAKWVSIGEQDELWVIGTDNSVWRWDWKTRKNVKLPGAVLRTIDVLRPGKMVGTSTDNSVWFWENDRFVQLPGMCTRATMTDGMVYCVSTDFNIWWGSLGVPQVSGSAPASCPPPPPCPAAAKCPAPPPCPKVDCSSNEVKVKYEYVEAPAEVIVKEYVVNDKK